MEGTYTIERTRRGILVRGSIPVADFAVLTKSWAKEGFDGMAIGVAHALGATFAVCRKSERKAWEEEVNKIALERAGGDAELAWRFGTDTGESSLTLFHALSMHPQSLPPSFEPSIPNDPDDFGRCYRLLQRFPDWRERLQEVSARYPLWAPMVDAWDELSMLWEAEYPTGHCPKLYGRMKQLVEEGERIDEQSD